MQKSKINLSLLIEMFWLSPSRTSYRKNKRFFMRLDYHTLSFFPLFGILVIHLPYVNGKHDGKITKFAVTKLKACKDWNHSERQSDVLWLADIFYGIQLVTWIFLWWKRGNVICNFLVVSDIMFAYLFLNRKVLVSARVPALLALQSHKCLGRLQVFQKINYKNNSFTAWHKSSGHGLSEKVYILLHLNSSYFAHTLKTNNGSCLFCWSVGHLSTKLTLFQL